MSTVLKDLFTSKKFLAALSAVILYLAGRFGFDLDPAALDRIFAALLVYVGAQGVADVGKGAAVLHLSAAVANQNASIAIADANATANGLTRPTITPIAAMLAVLLFALGSAALPACATARPRATAGLDALIDCTAPARTAVVADLGHALVDYARKFVSGDGAMVNIDKLKASASALKGEVIGSCGLIAALAILATPKPESARSLLAEPDPGQWRGALEAVRAELGVRAGGAGG